MSNRDPILELREVSASYGKVRALHGVSLKISPGEVVALIGANGAGKSTTLRVMSGLIGATTGDILLDGVSIARQRPDTIVRRGIAHCPEERRIWPELTVHENLVLGGYICGDRAEVIFLIATRTNRNTDSRSRDAKVAAAVGFIRDTRGALRTAFMNQQVGDGAEQRPRDSRARAVKPRRILTQRLQRCRRIASREGPNGNGRGEPSGQR